MTYTRSQLIDEIQSNYELLIHDDYDEETDMAAADHLAWLNRLSNEQLVDILFDDADMLH